jgi:ABC-type Mn2+/Zn2+ transport system permease subunit
MVYAAVIGIAGYGIGLLLSVWFDLPAGVTIVCAMALIGLTTAILKRAS